MKSRVIEHCGRQYTGSGNDLPQMRRHPSKSAYEPMRVINATAGKQPRAGNVLVESEHAVSF